MRVGGKPPKRGRGSLSFCYSKITVYLDSRKVVGQAGNKESRNMNTSGRDEYKRLQGRRDLSGTKGTKKRGTRGKKYKEAKNSQNKKRQSCSDHGNTIYQKRKPEHVEERGNGSRLVGRCT